MTAPLLVLLLASVCACFSWPALLTGSLPQPQPDPDLAPVSRKLHGRFLHITDIHPDPYYKAHTSVDELCHRGKTTHDKTGIFGRPTSECDSPMSLVNATFDWIDKNLKDQIDFVIWTGDNARHDNDNALPRRESFIFDMNQQIMDKFTEVFASDDPSKKFTLPIVPSLGNNDVYPHNVFPKGPNAQTKKLYHVWRDLVPEEQFHVFDRGVSFMVEVIPGKLAVLSLNTLYWFRSNTLVDGCDSKKDPGHLLFRWMSIVFAELRARNMKVWLSGHVPPNEKLYEPSCLDRLTAWLYEYRDIVVGGVYGHMNIDHFLLLDSKAVTPDTLLASAVKNWDQPEITIQDKMDYLQDVRTLYSEVHANNPARYSMAYISPSVIPTYLPSLRVWEYNTTGVDENAVSVYANGMPLRPWAAVFAEINAELDRLESEDDEDDFPTLVDDEIIDIEKKKKKKKKTDPTWPPSFPNVPLGPAHIPQLFTPTRYTQYYLDLEKANKAGNVTFEKEYATDEAPLGIRPALVVKEWIKVAKKLGAELVLAEEEEDDDVEAVAEASPEDVEEKQEQEEQIALVGKKHKGKKGKHGGKKKHKKTPTAEKSRVAWKKFLHYAFVSSGYEETN